MTLQDELNGREILQRVFHATEIDKKDSIKVKTVTFCALGDITEAMVKVNKSLEQPLKVIQGGNSYKPLVRLDFDSPNAFEFIEKLGEHYGVEDGN